MNDEKNKPKSLKQELNNRMKTIDVLDIEKPKYETSKDEEEIIQEASNKISKKDIEEEKKSISSKEETLIPLEDYIKCAVHLGTKVITPHMRKYVYKRRADGLAVINTILIDKQLREAIEFLNKYNK